jgi:hypothetical protein
MEETIQFQELIEPYHPQTVPIRLYNDNKAAVTFGNTEGSKPFKIHHIRTRFLKIQDLVRKKRFELIHLSNSKLFTDIFTKPLGPRKFAKFRESLKRNNFPISLQLKSLKKAVGLGITHIVGYPPSQLFFSNNTDIFCYDL